MLAFAAALALGLEPGTAIGDTDQPNPNDRTQKTLTLSAIELLGLAERAQKAGKLTVAEGAYEALARDRDAGVRAEALLRHGLMLSRAGRKTKAAIILRRLLDIRPDAQLARLEIAAILTELGDEQAARRELRALRAGALPPNIARMVDRWSEVLRANKPMGISLEIAMAPDSNINRATRSDTLGTVLGDFDIDESSTAKSGVGLSIRTSAYRRLRMADDVNLLGKVSTFSDLYRDKANNLVAAEAIIGPEFSLGRTQVSLEAAAGLNRYGGKPFTRQFRLSAVTRRSIGPRTAVSARSSLTSIKNRFNSLQDGQAVSLGLSAERALSSSKGIFVHAAGERFKAADSGYSTRTWRVGLQGWHEIGRLTFLAGAEVGRVKADERLFLLPEERRDAYSKLSFGATFRSFTFASIAPFIRLSRETNQSNIAFYDYRRTRTELGFTRAF